MEAVLLDPCFRLRAQPARRGVVLCRGADAHREMIGPRERPQVAGLFQRCLDGNARGCAAVDEEARSDGELCAREWASELLAHDAGGAVGAEHLVELVLTTIGADSRAGAVMNEIHDLLGNKARPGGYRGVGKRAIEHRAADDEQRTAGRGTAIDQRDVRGAFRAFDGRGLHDDGRQRGDVDDVAHKGECASGQPAAAWLLTRVGRIEQCDRRAGARESNRSHGARRSRANNGNAHVRLSLVDSWPRAESYHLPATSYELPDIDYCLRCRIRC